MSGKTLKIKELDLGIIDPCESKMYNKEQGGSKTVIIGKPGYGKTWLIKSLLYAKKHIFPCAEVQNGTEDANKAYKGMIPDVFIYEDLDVERIAKYIERQKIAREYLKNPWSVLLLDDCVDESKDLNNKHVKAMFKKGRHYKSWFILSLQQSLDLPKNIRNSVDGVFILKETNFEARQSLYKNYANTTLFPDFKSFCDVLDQITDDYTALYMHNYGITTSNMEDSVFWYKASKVPDNFKFGSKDYWAFNHQRYDPNYQRNF